MDPSPTQRFYTKELTRPCEEWGNNWRGEYGTKFCRLCRKDKCSSEWPTAITGRTRKSDEEKMVKQGSVSEKGSPSSRPSPPRRGRIAARFFAVRHLGIGCSFAAGFVSL